MEIPINENITVWQKYNPFEISLARSISRGYGIVEDYEMYEAFLNNPMKIKIADTWYDIFTLSDVVRSRNEDGYYRLIYIQINWQTGEYYIGKVNRKRWSEVKRYQGSGLLFTKKYKKHKEEFVRYYIAKCKTAKETEELEAKIVNENLLNDCFCLNLIKGGGGINSNNNSQAKRDKQKQFMKEHPELYSAMIERARELYHSGDTSALKERSERIKTTMNTDEYRKMTSARIKKWRQEHPEEYAQARENNRLSQLKPETKEKRKQARLLWKEKHPEEYIQMNERMVAKLQTEEAKQKRRDSMHAWYIEHPEQARENVIKRSRASVEKMRKPVNMLDLTSGEILKTFESQHAAAQWLVDEGIAKNMNCVSSINSVCQKKPCSTGYGYHKKAYGYGWEYAPKEGS